MDPSEEQSRKIAHQAEKDLNSYPAKVGHGGRILPGYETQTAKGLTGDSSKNKLSMYLSTIQIDICLPSIKHPALESGVDTAVENRFDGAKVTYGSAASGAGGNRVIPPEEGGDILPGKGGGR